MTEQTKAQRLADWLQAAVQTYPQMSEDEPGGYCTEVDQIMDESAAELRRLDAALDAALAKVQEPVAGWKLVPVEPTPEMLSKTMKDCGGIGAGSCGEHTGVDYEDLRSVYDAMLNAAPPAPAATVKGES
jgi:hypothetical protein